GGVVRLGPWGGPGTRGTGGVTGRSPSIPADMAAAVGRRLAERDLLMLDAPVGGGPVRAAEGRMVVMASGPEDAFARAADLIAAASGTLHRVGTEHGQGSAVKAVEQMLTGIHAAAVAEATAFGVRAGVDPQRLAEIIAPVPFHIPSQRPLGIVGTALGSVMAAAPRVTVPTPLAPPAL
ncbi:NAD-binding protein, partial [Azospirillum brasilense]|nr:NAD-binding protein [Azospirillum brasilense]